MRLGEVAVFLTSKLTATLRRHRPIRRILDWLRRRPSQTAPYPHVQGTHLSDGVLADGGGWHLVERVHVNRAKGRAEIHLVLASKKAPDNHD